MLDDTYNAPDFVHVLRNLILCRRYWFNGFQASHSPCSVLLNYWRKRFSVDHFRQF